ncbi:molybdenum ABC transporter ATP-binding protein [Roseobacteraceae bacterium S113]
MSLRVHLQHQVGALALDVAFEAPPGITVLFGPSGSGKTTIIRAVAGLLRADRAEIALEGETLASGGRHMPAHRRGFGYIFQDHRLFPHLSVRDNLRYGARFARGAGAALSEARIVEMLGIGALMARRPAALSGGEAARVAIGRALLARPRMLLADEPLASLDAARKAEILPYFERLRDEVDVPMLYVSHAAGEVARLATTVVALRAGRVQKVGPAGEVLADPMVTPLGPRGAGAMIQARVRTHHSDGVTELDASGQALFLPGHVGRVGGVLRVRIAAQDVILSTRKPEGLSALNVIAARVSGLRTGDGPGAMVALEAACGPLLARVTARSVAALGLEEGRAVWAVLKTVAVAPEDVGG